MFNYSKASCINGQMTGSVFASPSCTGPYTTALVGFPGTCMPTGNPSYPYSTISSKFLCSNSGSLIRVSGLFAFCLILLLTVLY